MSIAGVRGRNHRLAVFTRVFGDYIDGRASVEDVQV